MYKYKTPSDLNYTLKILTFLKQRFCVAFCILYTYIVYVYIHFHWEHSQHETKIWTNFNNSRLRKNNVLLYISWWKQSRRLFPPPRFSGIQLPCSHSCNGLREWKNNNVLTDPEMRNTVLCNNVGYTHVIVSERLEVISKKCNRSSLSLSLPA